MNLKFCGCERCGSLVAVLRGECDDLSCCGEKMRIMDSDVSTGAREKHAPVVKREGNTVSVCVGEVPHPMSPEHYIAWICLETEHGVQLAQLAPTDEPKAKFSLLDGEEVRGVYAFCNQHNLWRN